jgi:hypothetical protein
VRGKAVAEVWFEFRHEHRLVGHPLSGTGRSDTERQVTREPDTRSRQPTQSLGLGDTLRYAQLTSVENKGVKYEQATTSNRLPLRMATSQRM